MISLFPSYESASEDFKSFYDSRLHPVLEKLELDRKRIIKEGSILVLMVMLLFLFFFLLFDAYVDESDQGVFMQGLVASLFLVVVAFLSFRISPMRKSLQDRYKTDVIGTLVKFFDESLEYQPRQGFNKNFFDQTRIFGGSPNLFRSEDYVSGNIGKTRIRFSEIHAQKESGFGKNRRVKDIFKGILFAADFNKHFSGQTIVVQDFAEFFLGSFGTFLQKNAMNRDSLVKLEDEEFEKRFAVYSTNPTEARYILSPLLMERIKELDAKAGGINLSFVNANVCIAIPVNEDLFEADIIGSLLDNRSINRYHFYLKFLVNIVEDLELNTRIWTKE